MKQVLVFAKAPVVGAVKTRLAAAVGTEAACELYRAFLRDTAAVVAELEGIRVEWWVDGDPGALEEILGKRWTVREQPDGELGTRLAFAFGEAFRFRGGPVAVIGTDAPLLSADRIGALFERLKAAADAAIIPADDGGYVALGLASPCAEVFTGIPWSTEGVCRATVEALKTARRSVHLLEPAYDVDHRESLSRLASDLQSLPGAALHSAEALRRLAVVHRREAVVDALGRGVAVAPEPRRIVSLVPSVTECLFDAGLGTRVVGRTDYCISPPEAARLPSVGGPKTVDVDALLRLAPDLVLANVEENDRGQVETIASAAVRVHVAFPKTIEDVASLLRDLGVLLHATATFGGFARALKRVTPPSSAQRKVLCACLVWKDPYMAASQSTLTSALLEAAGGENVLATSAEFRYPSVSLEEVAAARPRVVLLPSEPYEFTGEDVRQVEASVPGAKALCIPGQWVTWYGSRMEEAILGLRRVLDPFR